MNYTEYIGKKFKKNGIKHLTFIVADVYTVTNSSGEIIKHYFTAYNEFADSKIYDFEVPISTVMRGLIK